MALEKTSRPLAATCLQCARRTYRAATPIRTFTTTSPTWLDTVETGTSSTQPPPPIASNSNNATNTDKTLDPFTVASARAERQLLRTSRQVPIGSRRRRAAMQSTSNVPFAELPYQCFQDARAVLKTDRADKLEDIRIQRTRIDRLKANPVAPQDEARHERSLAAMRRRLEHLKILADINDPLVKKTFEDGQGDMNKPIYRYLADRSWRSYKRPLLLQRITQMTVIPDVLPVIDPVVSTALSFGSLKVQHGDFVPSLLSATPPSLNVQMYTPEPQLVTIAVVNPDVPDVENDSFTYRCHFLASNIPLTALAPRINLSKLSAEKVLIPWLPAYAQKGAPYPRMSIFILQQPSTSEGTPQELDLAAIREAGRYTVRDGFKLRSLQTKYGLKPIGVDLFRTKYDEGTEQVMRSAGIEGADVEWRRKRIEPLPYSRRDGDKYR